MAKKERNPERTRLVKALLAEYQPKDLLELQDVLNCNSRLTSYYITVFLRRF